MSVIEMNHITKDYGNQKGVFDVSFSVEKGEILGFLGPNGAGKTTTIRQLMGFIKPDTGTVKINGMDCFKEVHKVQNILGYLPGEIAFMEDMTGIDFIRFIANMKNIKDVTKAKYLIQFLELDPNGKIKKMSKGMKQKIGIVIALMQDPEILILDEPTSGLDPLMQNKFVELIQQEKKKGTTILMSSHIFEEVEHTCDRVVIIKDGSIKAIERMEDLRNSRKKVYEIFFQDEKSALSFQQAHPSSVCHGSRIVISYQGSIDPLLKELAGYTIMDMTIRTQSLEELFLQYYGGEKQ